MTCSQNGATFVELLFYGGGGGGGGGIKTCNKKFLTDLMKLFQIYGICFLADFGKGVAQCNNRFYYNLSTLLLGLSLCGCNHPHKESFIHYFRGWGTQTSKASTHVIGASCNSNRMFGCFVL